MKKNPFVVDLETYDYRKTYELQLQTRRAVAQKDLPNTLLLVVHPPVITLGKRAKKENLLLEEGFLREKGIDLVRVERGGDVTYHGPGQLVAYPIFNIGSAVHRHVKNLAEAARLTCEEFGVFPKWDEKRPGLWVKNGKIAAIGVHVHRGVSLHGLALNVFGALEGFQWIVPCGLQGITITSLEKEGTQRLQPSEVGKVLSKHLASVMGCRPFIFLRPFELFSKLAS